MAFKFEEGKQKIVYNELVMGTTRSALFTSTSLCKVLVSINVIPTKEIKVIANEAALA